MFNTPPRHITELSDTFDASDERRRNRRENLYNDPTYSETISGDENEQVQQDETEVEATSNVMTNLDPPLPPTSRNLGTIPKITRLNPKAPPPYSLIPPTSDPVANSDNHGSEPAFEQFQPTPMIPGSSRNRSTSIGFRAEPTVQHNQPLSSFACLSGLQPPPTGNRQSTHPFVTTRRGSGREEPDRDEQMARQIQQMIQERHNEGTQGQGNSDIDVSNLLRRIERMMTENLNQSAHGQNHSLGNQSFNNPSAAP